MKKNLVPPVTLAKQGTSAFSHLVSEVFYGFLLTGEERSRGFLEASKWEKEPNGKPRSTTSTQPL